MVNSKRFKPIADLARDSEREAAKALGAALQRLNDSKEQLQQLYSYREEYAQRLQQTGQQGMSAQKLNEYRHFITKVNAAIESQTAVVEQTQAALEEKKKFWFAKRGRSKAMDSVLDHYLEDERKQLDKREQREQDDRHGQGQGGKS
jgi:flagellar FliJ protein